MLLPTCFVNLNLAWPLPLYGRLQTGSLYQVRIIGALGLIDGGETDWKLLAVRTDDPLAAVLHGECLVSCNRADMPLYPLPLPLFSTPQVDESYRLTFPLFCELALAHTLALVLPLASAPRLQT